MIDLNYNKFSTNKFSILYCSRLCHLLPFSLFQTIIVDITPLFGFQMEGSIFTGLVNLFKEYVLTIEKALFYGSNVTEKDDSRINWDVAIEQQISILANLTALEQILPKILIRPINELSHPINSDRINERAISYQRKEIDIFALFVQEASSQIRVRFCQQYVTRVMSQETSCKLTSHTGNYVQGDASAVCDATPSVKFQVCLCTFLANMTNYFINLIA